MKVKRIIAGLLAMVMLLTATLPTSNVKAASGTASLDSLGKLGTVNVGSKSESGIWLQTLVNEKPVFCMDLGLACHTGYTYISKTKTISSDSSNKKDALEAKIGYWYAISKNKSNKAWVYAQCLIWAAEEGITSENGLKDIISQVKKNTGYYSNDTIYSDIFNPGKTVSCDVDIWEYSGRTKKNQVQRLLQINSTETEYNFYPLKSSDYYRQRITLQKQDEDGKALSQVTFRFTAKNIKELYSYQYNGWGDSVKEDVDDDATTFTQDVKTDSNGKIIFRFTYQLNSKKYYFIKSSPRRGQMATGVFSIGGKLYYFDPDTGELQTNTRVEYNDRTYTVDAQGVCTVVPEDSSPSAEMLFFLRFESGSSAYNQTGGDHGCACGAYQFDYRYSLKPFITYAYRENPLVCKEFKPFLKLSSSQLRSNSKFYKAWHQVYKRNKRTFSALQDTYARINYYDNAERKLQLSGIDIASRSDVVKGAVFSYSIQHGMTSAVNAVKAIKPKSAMSDAAFLKKLYNYRKKSFPLYASRYTQEYKLAISVLKK